MHVRRASDPLPSTGRSSGRGNYPGVTRRSSESSVADRRDRCPGESARQEQAPRAAQRQDALAPIRSCIEKAQGQFGDALHATLGEVFGLAKQMQQPGRSEAMGLLIVACHRLALSPTVNAGSIHDALKYDAGVADPGGAYGKVIDGLWSAVSAVKENPSRRDECRHIATNLERISALADLIEDLPIRTALLRSALDISCAAFRGRICSAEMLAASTAIATGLPDADQPAARAKLHAAAVSEIANADACKAPDQRQQFAWALAHVRDSADKPAALSALAMKALRTDDIGLACACLDASDGSVLREAVLDKLMRIGATGKHSARRLAALTAALEQSQKLAEEPARAGWNGRLMLALTALLDLELGPVDRPKPHGYSDEFARALECAEHIVLHDIDGQIARYAVTRMVDAAHRFPDMRFPQYLDRLAVLTYIVDSRNNALIATSPDAAARGRHVWLDDPRLPTFSYFKELAARRDVLARKFPHFVPKLIGRVATAVVDGTSHALAHPASLIEQYTDSVHRSDFARLLAALSDEAADSAPSAAA